MIEIDASGAHISPEIGRFAYNKCMLQERPKNIRLHPMQALAIVELIKVYTVKDRRSWYWRLFEKVKVLFRRERKSQMTFLGLPVDQNSGIPEDQIEFLGTEGEVIGKIKNLSTIFN